MYKQKHFNCWNQQLTFFLTYISLFRDTYKNNISQSFTNECKHLKQIIHNDW